MKYPRVKLDSIKADVPYAFVGGPFGSNLTTRDYVEEGVPVIRGNNQSNVSSFHDDDFVFVSEEKAVQLTPNLASPGDVIFTQRGTLGQVGVIPKNAKFDRYVISQSQMKLTVHPEKAEAMYVYYYFRRPDIVQMIINLSQSSGVPHINLGTLKNFEIPLPPIDIQQRIIATLSTYDDLIENNRRRIALLEQSARLLYKEWFVSLRFPGHEHVKVKDGVPQGWEMKRIGDGFSLLGGFSFKSNSYQESGRFGIVTIKNVQESEFNPICNAYVDDAPDNLPQHCYLSTGDILLSLTGNVGRVCIVFGEDYLLNQRVAKIVPQYGISKSYTYWLFTNDGFRKIMENLAYGVAQLNLSALKVENLDWAMPPKNLLDLFESYTRNIFDEISTLNLANQKLQVARDLLLPRLMNCEIPV
jgi:type I restriction enzyme, S subunit